MTCESDPVAVFPDIDPEDKDWHFVDFTQARWLERGQEVATTGIRFRVRSAPGFEYEVTTAGQTAAREPIFPKTPGVAIQDGSSTLTCRALSISSLERVLAGTPVWTGSAETVFSQQGVDGQWAKAVITPTAAVDGTDYPVMVKATYDNGTIIAKRCILPVRIPTRTCCA